MYPSDYAPVNACRAVDKGDLPPSFRRRTRYNSTHTPFKLPPGLLHRERRTLFRRHVPPPIIAAGCPPTKARPARCYAPRCAAVGQDFFARILFVWLWTGGCFALHHPLPLRVQMVPFRRAPRTRTPEHADTGMSSPRTLEQTRARRRGVVLGGDEALDVPPPGSTIPRRPRTALALLPHRP